MRIDGPGFAYRLPIQYLPYETDGMPPFAVGPGNPKYYEKSVDEQLTVDPSYQIASNRDDAENNAPVRMASDGLPSYKVNAPMNVNPKILSYDDAMNMESDNSEEMSPSKNVYFRDEIRMLENSENYQEDNGGGISDEGDDASIEMQSNSEKLQADVEKQPVDLDSAWVIGVIAGVSAAITVGLLAIGIGWYT